MHRKLAGTICILITGGRSTHAVGSAAKERKAVARYTQKARNFSACSDWRGAVESLAR